MSLFSLVQYTLNPINEIIDIDHVKEDSHYYAIIKHLGIKRFVSKERLSC